MKKICIVTATRSEYGLLKWVIDEIYKSPLFELSLIVTGGHLCVEQGYTIEYIKNDGYPIAEQFDIKPYYNTLLDVNESMAICQSEFGKILDKTNPDILIILGDRIELLPICFAALIQNIPIAHIAGGDITEGAIDNKIRNAVTMLSNYHFPGTIESAERLKRMLNSDKNIFVTGETNLDNFTRIKKLSRAELTKELGLDPQKEWVLCTYHAETTISLEDNLRRVNNLVELFSTHLTNKEVIITKANTDFGGLRINEIFNESQKQYNNIHLFSSLGQIRYISILYQVKFMIGNSSSGIFETPLIKLPVINIGNRQLGRNYTSNIILSNGDLNDLITATKKALSDDFLKSLINLENPYGDGHASEKIVSKIKDILYV